MAFTFTSVDEILIKSVIIEMKPFLQYMYLTYKCVDKSLSVTIQMKATEQYFLVVLFTTLYKVVLTFESVDEILKCDHSNESSTFLWCCLLCCTR